MVRRVRGASWAGERRNPGETSETSSSSFPCSMYALSRPPGSISFFSLGPFLNQHSSCLFLPSWHVTLTTLSQLHCQPHSVWAVTRCSHELLRSLPTDVAPAGTRHWILPSRWPLSTMFSSRSCSLLTPRQAWNIHIPNHI